MKHSRSKLKCCYRKKEEKCHYAFFLFILFNLYHTATEDLKPHATRLVAGLQLKD